jgi:hypothetical protein
VTHHITDDQNPQYQSIFTTQLNVNLGDFLRTHVWIVTLLSTLAQIVICLKSIHLLATCDIFQQRDRADPNTCWCKSVLLVMMAVF